MNDDQELEEIPILENELMWIARVVSEEKSRNDVDNDESE